MKNILQKALPISVIALCAIIWSFLLVPRIKEIVRYSRQIKAVEEEIAKLEKIKVEVPADMAEKLNNSLPEVLRAREFEESVKKYAEKYELTLVAFTINPKAETVKDMSSQAFEIKAQGQYKGMVDLIRDMENDNRIIIINDVSFENDGMQSILSVAVTGKLFYLKKA